MEMVELPQCCARGQCLCFSYWLLRGNLHPLLILVVFVTNTYILCHKGQLKYLVLAN